MKSKTCCFTGHRRLSEKEQTIVKCKLEDSVESLIQNGYRYFGAGGAIGFDSLAAQTVLRLQKKYPQIKLILVLPCVSQADRWAPADKMTYYEIMKQANKIVYTSQIYTKNCMFKRNRHLVNYSSACICYLNRSTGGTAYTVDYAHKCGLQIINIAE